jgi:hypothetical protein
MTGGITGPPCSWGIKIQGPGPTGWGSLEPETIKYDRESRGIRTRERLRWQGIDREGAPHQLTRSCLMEIKARLKPHMGD